MANSYLLEGQSLHQFGKEVLISQLRFSSLESIFKVDPEVQRELDPKKRLEIREFILNALDTKEFYFSPFIFSARRAIKLEEQKWKLEPGSKLFILDGQHRTSALSSAMNYLKTKLEMVEMQGNEEEGSLLKRKIEQLEEYPISMYIYLDLATNEEQQLFSDINTRRREAHVGLVMQYDQRDKYTELARKVAEKVNEYYEIEQKLSRITMQSTAVTSLAVMRRCLLAMFEGILSVKKGEPFFQKYHDGEVEEISLAFFTAWKQLFPRQIANRRKYVSGYTGIQIALGYTVYTLTKNHQLTHQEAIASLHILSKRCNWKHHDPLFYHLYDPDKKRIINHSATTTIRKTANLFTTIIEEEKGLIHGH
ncbi:DNA sulfur modification protein DndB [Cytobacillus gottheilii]|uniref:DNA sulfur modification protein DndB n=1 Tax=Cytobacillus gottheilii TaxID=859144 RepID=UPI0009BBA2EE|nr:DNA sulfur modification protein DndB [Cytobacillus gottheilii]